MRLIHAIAAFAAVTLPAHAMAEASEPIRCPLDAPYDAGNPFAKILSGQQPGAIIAQNRLVVALVPIDWENPGHALVITRRAVRNMEGLSDAEMVAAMHMIRRVAAAQRKALGATGYTVRQNNARNQEVCHIHFHVVPNTPVDKVDRATMPQMEAIAARLRAALPQD